MSGTGVVAEGVEFTDGTAVIRWRTMYRSTAVYESVAQLVHVHGHGGTTRVVWLDPERHEPPPRPATWWGQWGKIRLRPGGSEQ